jgi:16S rRNA (uracil1498-N3)-methyltransferase
MRLHLPELAPGRVEIHGAGFHYLAHVLRARPGDKVVLFDGAGQEADAIIEVVAEAGLVLSVSAPRAAATRGAPITLLCGLLKGEKMDLVIQKATELGAARIVPLVTDRSVVRLDEERGEARRARWSRIAAEAARQSRRADVPEIAAPTDFGAALAAAAPHALRLLLHEGETAPLRLDEPLEVVVAVGPEGGFSPEEVAAARAAGFQVAGLGPRVLRAETAAIAALAVVGYLLAGAG